MKSMNSLMKNNMRQYSMIIALVVIVIFFQIITSGTLLKPLNITNLILQNSYILVLAVGMVLVIITGHIDLSVGSIAAFVGAISAIMMVDMQLNPLLSIIVCLILGAVIGAWQGFWVAYVGIPAFIVTLAGMLLFRGLTLVVMQGQSIAPYPETFQKISTGFLPDPFNGDGIHVLSIIIGVIISLVLVGIEFNNRKNQLKYQFNSLPTGLFYAKVIGILAVVNIFTFVLASYRGIPNILVILFIIIAFYTFVMKKTIVGRHIYAVGGNLKAASLSGVKTKHVTFGVFVNMGVLAALSGLIFAARLNAATPRAGNLFELDAIAAVFIGGASAYGGVGTVIGAVVGGLVMGVMNNGMSIKGLGIDWQQAIKGLVLLVAVAFDIINKKKS